MEILAMVFTFDILCNFIFWAVVINGIVVVIVVVVEWKEKRIKKITWTKTCKEKY